MARKKSKRQIMREYEAFSRNGKNAGMKTSPYAEREKKPRKERAKLRLGKPLLWAALGVLLLAAAACAAVLLKDRAHDAARCYCVLADKNELRIGMSDESERKVASIIKKTKLDAGGAQKSDHKLVVNGKEYYYNRVSGRISYLEGSASAILPEGDRQRLNDLLGVGAVEDVVNPSSSDYKIKPLLIVTEGGEPRIELEIACSRETQAPYSALVFRLDENGEQTDYFVTPDTNGGAFGLFVGFEKCTRVSFPLDPDFISEPGRYRFAMCETDDGGVQGDENVIVIPGSQISVSQFYVRQPASRSIEFTVKKGRGDGALKLYRDEYSLMEQYPQLASLDTKEGVDVCICVNYRNYRCTLLPPGQRSALEMAAAAESASGGHSLTLEEARMMLEHYGVPREKVFIKPYNSPYLSVVPVFDPNEEYFREYLKRLLYDEVEKEEDAEPGPTERPGPADAPQAHSENISVRLTAVGWDLGEGLRFADGFTFCDSLSEIPSPGIAVLWENLGTEAFTINDAFLLEYSGGDGQYSVTHIDGPAADLPHILLPGSSAVEYCPLGGADISLAGRYRLWLNLKAQDPFSSIYTSVARPIYYVDFTVDAAEPADG